MPIPANPFTMHSILIKTLLLTTLHISLTVGSPLFPFKSNEAHNTGDKSVKFNAPTADSAMLNADATSSLNAFGTLAAKVLSTPSKAPQTLSFPYCDDCGACPKVTDSFRKYTGANADAGPFQANAVRRNNYSPSNLNLSNEKKLIGLKYLETRGLLGSKRCHYCKIDPTGKCSRHCDDCKKQKKTIGCNCSSHCADCKEQKQTIGCNCSTHCSSCHTDFAVGKCIPYHCLNCTPDYTCGPHLKTLEGFSEEEIKQVKAGLEDPDDIRDY